MSKTVAGLGRAPGCHQPDEQGEIVGQFALKPGSYYDPTAEEE